ncbi:Asp23/Gls24 family envelope stress response protein [Streptomyces sp. NBC_01264]|uniref:Asp23/Gls24 family envelope stress response protein n=1 Tax=Streptomyces sp. NBC_01264 TaxID=2903804 RepID=UPI002259F9F1|nr:Asp23/Gls24 family envelope stress response protein [Streptomyces sp. NBC_01264]MCX4782850.1 Asp23/Gls24 family envelope stress response protein [Streptomyces sp. NBC_01264]
MTAARHGDRTHTEIGEAVLGVRGVAFLKPALGDLLRAAAVSGAGRRPPLAAPRRAAGIRITPSGKEGGPAVEVHVVLLRGHRALDVTRAIRATVRSVYPSSRTIPVHVTVTGIV